MAIPSPTVPSSISAVGATSLRPTLSNKTFYVNSGLVSANNTETTVISINDIGKRDILFCINPIFTSSGTDDMTMKLKNNGAIIYQMIVTTQNFANTSSPLHFIIPANTNIEITFTNADATSHNVGISAYGYYL